MEIFGNDQTMRGCYFRVNKTTVGGRGAYVTTGGGVLPASSDGSDPMIVTGLNFVQKEKIHIVQCFQDTNHTYAFGLDPSASTIQVLFTGFLVAKGGAGLSGVIDKFTSAFSKGRVSQYQDYASVTIGSSTLNGFLVGLSSFTADSQYNLQSFVMDMQVVKAFGS